MHKTTGTYRRFSSHKTEADIVQWANGSWPDGLPQKDGAHALSGAGSDDTATTQLGKTSRTKNLIIELQEAYFYLFSYTEKIIHPTFWYLSGLNSHSIPVILFHACWGKLMRLS